MTRSTNKTTHKKTVLVSQTHQKTHVMAILVSITLLLFGASVSYALFVFMHGLTRS